MQTGKKFDEKIYTSIAIDKLTIFAIFHLTIQGEECAFERIVKECFDLFPKRFSLRRYGEWPDSNRVYLSMMRCRDSGWIVGNEKSGFKITEFGKKVAEEVYNQLNSAFVTKIRKKINMKPRERGEAIINFIKKSKAFAKFSEDKDNFNITEAELREMLGATRETPKRVLRQNYEYYLNISRDYGEKELLEFLSICKNRFKLN